MDYPDGSGADIYRGGDDEIECLMFNHGGGALLFEALYELARVTQSVVHWPDTAPIVADLLIYKEYFAGISATGVGHECL
jgi:hypothetical protein